MFTGLVEDVGTLVAISPQGRGRRLTIQTTLPLHEVRIGDSIAVHGACLTAEAVQGDAFEVVAGQETLDFTILGDLQRGSRVHLERAMRVDARLDGHLVTGHVDGTGRVERSFEQAESWILWLDVGTELARYVARKGSLCVDGVSLTVNEVAGTTCRLNLVPHTARSTQLGALTPGDRVNLEVDLLARYVERLLQAGTSKGLDLNMLREHGFT